MSFSVRYEPDVIYKIYITVVRNIIYRVVVYHVSSLRRLIQFACVF